MAKPKEQKIGNYTSEEVIYPEHLLGDFFRFVAKLDADHAPLDDLINSFVEELVSRGVEPPKDNRIVLDALEVLELGKFVSVDERLREVTINHAALSRDYSVA